MYRKKGINSTFPERFVKKSKRRTTLPAGSLSERKESVKFKLKKRNKKKSGHCFPILTKKGVKKRGHSLPLKSKI